MPTRPWLATRTANAANSTMPTGPAASASHRSRMPSPRARMEAPAPADSAWLVPAAADSVFVLAPRSGIFPPMKYNRFGHVGMQAVMHWARQGSPLQGLAMRMVSRERHEDFDRQSLNAPRSARSHFLFHAKPHAAQIDRVALGMDAHDRGHAGGKSGGDQIGRRKRFAATVVVHRRVGRQASPRVREWRRRRSAPSYSTLIRTMRR